MGAKRLDSAEVARRLALRGVRLVDEYINQNTKSLVECDKGHRWYAVPRCFFIENSGCPQCNNRVTLTNDVVDARFLGTGYFRLGDVTGALKSLKVRCILDNCGYEWEPQLSAILNAIQQGKHRCPKCNDLIRLTNDEVDRRLATRPIARIGDAGTKRSYCKFKCLNETCGNVWDTLVGAIAKGSGCPACSYGGFRKHKPAVVYVYNIADKFCGYGISGEFRVRDQTHRKHISRAGYSHKLVGCFEMPGSEAARIEAELKRTFEVADSGIPSFRTECTTIENLPRVLDFINGQLNQCQ